MTFHDVQTNGWIQPYKPVYTMRDFNRLCEKHDAKTARFILVCSSAYYDIDENRECRFSKALEKKLHNIMHRDDPPTLAVGSVNTRRASPPLA